MSVTGGARSFDLPPRLLQAIRKGLTRAADTTDAWIVTGGTHTGVMKLVGELMADLTKDKFVPVIGIASWGIIHKKEELVTAHLKARLDIPIEHQQATSLDQNHNMFLLVDNGTANFGAEINFRARFEAAAREDFSCPVVTLVVQGGPNTLKTARDAIGMNNPVVVIDGSGMAADVLAYAYNFTHNGLSKYQTYTVDGLRDVIAHQFGSLDHDTREKILHDAFECVRFRDKVFIYNFQEADGQDIDEAILNAVFQGSDVGLKSKLRQAMNFDRLDMASEALLEAQQAKRGQVVSPEEIDEMVNENLMAALAHNMPHFVELYLDYGACIRNLKPSINFRTWADDNRGQLPILPDVALALEELYSVYGKQQHSHVQRLVELESTRFKSKTRPFNVLHVGSVLSKLISKDFSIDRQLASFVNHHFQREHDSSLREEVAMHMFLLWAVCIDKYRMAELFWLRGNQSIPNALVSSRVLYQLSRHKAVSGPHLVNEREKMRYNAKKFEELAVGVLSECQSADADKTSAMLRATIPMFVNQTPIDVAYQSESLKFLSHPATQSVVNRQWFGNIKILTTAFRVVLGLLIPILVIPFIKFVDDEANKEEDTAYFIAAGLNQDAKKETTFARLKRKFSNFYSAPFTRFTLDYMSHLTLCLLFSYVVLDDMPDYLGSLEVFTLVWFLSLVSEELRQMHYGWRLDEHFEDQWNRLDAVILMLYFVGFIVRTADVTNSQAKIDSKAVYAFVVMALWLRLMRYYAVSKFLGPKLIMMGQMVRDVLTFVFLIVVFLFGYGVAAQSLLFPLRPVDDETFENVLFRPYFQIYGELFLEDMNAESDCAGASLFTGCGAKNSWLVPVLLGAYILVTNILLVNLLIAMFSDTYGAVQAQSMDLWHKQNYELYVEYRDRPFLPPPLILFEHLVRGLKYVISRFCKPDDDEGPSIKQKELEHRLVLFQELNTNRYLDKKRQGKREETESRIKDQHEVVQRMRCMLEDLDEQLIVTRVAMDRHLLHVRQELNDVKSYVLAQSAAQGLLQDDVDMMKRQQMLSLAEDFTDPFDAIESGHWLPTMAYPTKDGIRRFPLTPEQVPWEADVPDYKPVEYTHVSVHGAEWADDEDPTKYDYNASDETTNRSTCQTVNGEPALIEIDSTTGRPINPYGRTGMTGRGLLGKWGVNWAADTVVTRWRRDRNGVVMERDGLKVLEFVAIKRRDGYGWAIPGGFREGVEGELDTFGREFIEETMNKSTGGDFEELTEDERKTVRELFQHAEPVCKIYSQDNRNTDNAWIETSCVNFHDESGRLTEKLQFNAGDDACDVDWFMVHSGHDLFASHMTLLRYTARLHRAYF
eukprot:TRINITY_DN12352_c1_g1_i1.p1 TRINITY_DN12352_c1_g1~~TRINITY_DN12352_c1_g1_i1.p1  ORF type:complete len:1459 (+),score=335.46 TRINITY_DN12352_c1_g1_i1:373-4377(+)